MKCPYTSFLEIITQMSAVVFTWLISGCSLPVWSFLLSTWDLAAQRARSGVLCFTLVASSPCLLCSTSYITNCVVITDVTFLMAQLLQPKRLEWYYKDWERALDLESRQVALPLPLGLRFLKSWTTSSFLMLSGRWNWELSSFPGSWFLLCEFLNVKASIMVPSCRGRVYPWKLFLGQDKYRIAASTQSFVS